MRFVIIGASEQASVLADIAGRIDGVQLVGFLDREKPAGSDFCDYPVFGNESELSGLVETKNLSGYVIGIGDNACRRKCVEHVETLAPNLPAVSLVDPSAVVSSRAEIGAGAVVMPHAFVGPRSRVGRHCILNTHASLDHDGYLEDFASLAPGVITGGNVRVGQGSAICLGASIIHGITVGADTVVGAGSLVVDNVPAKVLAYGSPLRVIRQRSPDEPYL